MIINLKKVRIYAKKIMVKKLDEGESLPLAPTSLVATPSAGLKRRPAKPGSRITKSLQSYPISTDLLATNLLNAMFPYSTT